MEHLTWTFKRTTDCITKGHFSGISHVASRCSAKEVKRMFWLAKDGSIGAIRANQMAFSFKQMTGKVSGAADVIDPMAVSSQREG